MEKWFDRTMAVLMAVIVGCMSLVVMRITWWVVFEWVPK